jgi:hypothetical protein
MCVDRSYMLAELDPQKISTIACWLMEIYHVILARIGLGSDMKLNMIELEDRIWGYVLGTTMDLALLGCCKVQTL